jgi:hypothetical protein
LCARAVEEMNVVERKNELRKERYSSLCATAVEGMNSV